MTPQECRECSSPITVGSKSGLCNPCSHKGSRAYNWKETDYGYHAVHNWLRRVAGKASYCSYDASHKSNRFEWSNNSGEYKRELSDWEQLCPSCHRKKDFKESTRQKMSLMRTGKKIPAQHIPVIAEKNGVFVCQYSSVSYAAEQVGVCRTAISNALIGRSKTCGGYTWRYLNEN